MTAGIGSPIDNFPLVSGVSDAQPKNGSDKRQRSEPEPINFIESGVVGIGVFTSLNTYVVINSCIDLRKEHCRWIHLFAGQQFLGNHRLNAPFFKCALLNLRLYSAFNIPVSILFSYCI